MVWGFLRLEYEQLLVVGAPAQKELELQSLEPMAVGADQSPWSVSAEVVALLERRLALDVRTPPAKVRCVDIEICSYTAMLTIAMQARLVEAAAFGASVFLFVAVLGYLSEYS